MLRNTMFGIVGTTMQTRVRGSVSIEPDQLMLISTDGLIQDVLVPRNPDYPAAKKQLLEQGILVEVPSSQVLCPGLIDLHIHAPQWPQIGKAYGVPLLDWLQSYTFPLESRYSSLAFAESVYDSMVQRLLANGTTTAVYFSSLHVEASILLAEMCMRYGQRAFVGKVAMDNPEQCPDYYRDESADTSVSGTRTLIDSINTMQSSSFPLVKPIVTPRFLPSCSDRALRGLANLATEYDCHIQTHCAESMATNDYSLKRFNLTETQALHHFDLMGDKTVLAHCCHLSEDDMQVMSGSGAGVAHCALSNINFAEQMCPTSELLEREINCGLGSDVAGGSSPSIFRAATDAISVSTLRSRGLGSGNDQQSEQFSSDPINYADAFWMATSGAAAVLNEKIGQFKPGFYFDALSIETESNESTLRYWPKLDSLNDLPEKIIHGADSRSICHVWVAGKQVHSNDRRALKEDAVPSTVAET